jgi:rare lipoprotein A
MGAPYRLALRIAGMKYLPLCLGLAALLVGGLGLNGCSRQSLDPFAGTPSPMYQGSGPLPKGGGRYHVGKPYEVAGRRYYPSEDPSYDKVGMASWYGPNFHRRMTSNGEWFDQDYLSAAHPTLPLPSYARVTNLENGRAVVVRINDRGPFVADRIIDLSKKSADALGFRNRGTAKVRVQYLGLAPLNDNGAHLAAMNEKRDGGGPILPVMVAAKPQQPTPATVDPVTVAAMPQRVAASAAAAVQPVMAMPNPQDAPAEIQDDGFYVQVGSFRDPTNAGRAKANVASVGPVLIIPVDLGYDRYYRVQVGPLRGEDTAHAALARVHAAGHHDARLVVAQN